MRLDEYVTLHVRAQHEAEARGRAVAWADENMPGKAAVMPARLETRRLQSDFDDLYAVAIYPAPKGL